MDVELACPLVSVGYLFQTCKRFISSHPVRFKHLLSQSLWGYPRAQSLLSPVQPNMDNSSGSMGTRSTVSCETSSDSPGHSEQISFRSEWEKEMGQSTHLTRYDETSVLTLCFHKNNDDLGVHDEVGCPLAYRYQISNQYFRWKGLPKRSKNVTALKSIIGQ